MDENNQYRQAMTKSLPYGCIKRQNKVPTFEELAELLKKVTLGDKIGHVFTVDIEFSNVKEKTLLFNEIYPSVFEKNKKTSPHERSTVQIMSRAEKKMARKKFLFYLLIQKHTQL